MRLEAGLTSTIAQRYKDYNKLRSALSNPQSAPPSSPSRRKRSHPHLTHSLVHSETPSKRHKQLHKLHPSFIDPYDPPTSLILSPSQQRKSIGPTPQKDGQVLGLFDGISGTSTKIPSKSISLGDTAADVQATPSKKPNSDLWLGLKGSQTEIAPTIGPSLPDVKMTPSMQRVTQCRTPGSRGGVSKLRFDDTPVFLRRGEQRTVAFQAHTAGEEADALWSPITVRRLPQPAGRSLSAILKNLRAMEDEKLDEDLDLLREVKGGSPALDNRLPRPKFLVEDSQRPDMPLGPDGESKSELDANKYANEGEGRGGKILKVWKKKGQKRTTRRVDMKPNTAKWKPEPKWKDGNSQEDDDEDNIVESQAEDAESRATSTGADGAYRGLRETNGKEDSAVKRPKVRPKPEQRLNPNKDGLLTKAKKKISVTAHANFRALKIKNKHSKAKGAGRRSGVRR